MNSTLHRFRTVVSAATLAAGLLTLAAAASLSGCVGYNVYPAEEGGHGFTNPNSDPLPALMTESVRWVRTRYGVTDSMANNTPAVPIEGDTSQQFAVNLPVGVNRAVYETICKNIGVGAVPMEPGNEKLPIYSVVRIWVRGDEAKVDVVRPLPNMPAGADGRPTTQGITVNFRGGIGPWHPVSHNTWSPNALPTPPLNYLPEK